MAAPLRLVFMGTSAFAVPILKGLANYRHPLGVVYTQPARPAGRGQQERRTPVHEAALALGLPVRTPVTLKDADAAPAMAAFDLDLAVVAAYGLLLPRAILTIPRLGCINVHGSVLPRWRGAAPIQRAIMAGDRTTGISLFQMEPGLDTGPVFSCRETEIGPREHAGELMDRLAAMASEMLPELLEQLVDGKAEAVPQPTEGITYASKILKEEARLDLGRPAIELDGKIRAIGDQLGCWVEARGERLVIVEAEPVAGQGEPGTVLDLPLIIACGEGALRVRSVKRAGRKAMSAADLQRGFALPLGSKVA